MMGCERIISPKTLHEALSTLAKDGDAITPANGGTDLFVAAQLRKDIPVIAETLMDLKGVAELNGIAAEGDTLFLGAGCTFSDVLESPLIAEAAPLLTLAAEKVASPQIRNIATLGGNVMNASPAADGLTALVCLGAYAVLVSEETGMRLRRIPIYEFVTGPRRTLRQKNELLLRFEIPVFRESRCVYEKVGLRSAMAIAVTSAAILVEKGGKVHAAIGSMGPRTVVSSKAERMAEGGDIDGAVKALLAECTPISDIRATADYRLMATENILRRHLSDLAKGGAL